MEEILSSIKRIIAEDGEASGPLVRRGRRTLARTDEEGGGIDSDDSPFAQSVETQAFGASDILELTDAFAMPGSPHAPMPDGLHETPAAMVAAFSNAPKPSGAEPVAKSPPMASPAPAMTAPAAPVDARSDQGAILSEAAIRASRQSLAQLSAMVVRPGEGAGEQTLDGLVRDLLRPMMADWLEAHLPAIVERIVAREVARLVADAN